MSKIDIVPSEGVDETQPLETQQRATRQAIARIRADKRRLMREMEALDHELNALHSHFTALSQARFLRDNAHRVYDDLRKFDEQAAACLMREMSRLET